MRKVIQKISLFYLGALYIVLTLLVGECHPFSSYPMFSSFPAQGEFVYVSNTKNEIISARKNFNYTTDEMMDILAINSKNRPISCAGTNTIMKGLKENAMLDTVCFHHVLLKMKGYKIETTDKIICTGVAEKK